MVQLKLTSSEKNPLFCQLPVGWTLTVSQPREIWPSVEVQKLHPHAMWSLLQSLIFFGFCAEIPPRLVQTSHSPLVWEREETRGGRSRRSEQWSAETRVAQALVCAFIFSHVQPRIDSIGADSCGIVWFRGLKLPQAPSETALKCLQSSKRFIV